MNNVEPHSDQDLARRLVEAEATVKALLSGQIDAIFAPESGTPLLLSQAQQALRESEEQYRQIVEATTDGIVRLDSDNLITFANKRLSEMLGRGPSELMGLSIFACMGEAVRPLMTEALRTQGPALDTVFQHQDGTEVSVSVATSVLFDGEGHPIGNLGVIRNVTEQKKLQSQLMVSDRMASMGTLAAGVAHEINNPLAAVIANLEFVAESLSLAPDAAFASPPDARAWLHQEVQGPINDARSAADRVRLIVRDLKIFSRSPAESAGGPVDVKAVMESSLRMAWNEIRHRAHLVKLYGPVPAVEVNEARLGQVFLNLIVNAAQALPEGQVDQNEIRVTTRQEAGRVLIEVSDTGPGIPSDILGRIFDAFFTTKAVGAGTGLGLAICQRIVTDMGGQLTVRTEMGKGSCFTVALPVGGPDQRTSKSSQAVPRTTVAGRRGRILVVDDEELVLRAVERSLSKHHDVTVSVAARAALALFMGGERFDLILCDLMMPEMTGMDLYHQLAVIAPEQANRMIFLTGGAFTAKGRDFLSEPPKEHIEKPFDATNLRAMVQRYLR